MRTPGSSHPGGGSVVSVRLMDGPDARADLPAPRRPRHPWQEVKRQRNADGSTSSVWEKWFAFRADPPYLSLLGRYDPGMIVRRHGHRSPHVVYVIEGAIWCGDRLCEAGTHIELPEGAFRTVPGRPDGRRCSR